MLSTKWLPYSDVIRLKGVEDMVEVYYNSGQFPATMKLLEKRFQRPSEIFVNLAEYYEKNGLTGISHSRLARYEILYRFLEEDMREEERDHVTAAKVPETGQPSLADFRDSLMYDLYGPRKHQEPSVLCQRPVSVQKGSPRILHGGGRKSKMAHGLRWL